MSPSPNQRSPIHLGVNIDHVATLRNARGGTHPALLPAAAQAIAAGATSIVVHLREDRRHIRDADVAELLAALPVPLNLEMAATAEMVAIACRLRPPRCCIVPERRLELTTEGGLDVVRLAPHLTSHLAALKAANIAVSLFIDPDPAQVAAAAALGVPAIELHTGPYAKANGVAQTAELTRLRAAAEQAVNLGLIVHAGHGLTTANVGAVAAIAAITELNIGHFLIGEAITHGLTRAVQDMLAAMQAGRGV